MPKFRIYRYSDFSAPSTNNFIERTELIKEYVFTEDSIFRIMSLKSSESGNDLWTDGEINQLGQSLINSLEFNIYIVGNELKDYKKTIKPRFYIGNLNNVDGHVNWASTTRLISDFIKVNNGIIINTNSLYTFSVGLYDENKELIGSKSFYDNIYFYKIDNKNCKYIRIGIRNFVNTNFDFITTSPNFINEISEHITLYTNEDEYTDIITDNLSNNFLGEDIINEKYLPNNLTVEKRIDLDTFSIVNQTPFTHDDLVATQGFTSDKKRYLYVTIDNDDVNPCGIIKYDMLKDEIIKSSYSTSYGHGNGMTYIEKLKELWITSFDYDNLTDLFRVSKVDSETLEFKENIDLQTTLETYFSGILSSVNGVGAITYNKIHDKVVYLLRTSTDINNVAVKSLIICDTNNNVIAHKLIYDITFAGGLESDENYIYINRPNNHIDVYDWELNFIGNIYYNVGDAESEGLVIMNKCIYTNVNYQVDEYVKLYKLNTSTFNYRQ